MNPDRISPVTTDPDTAPMFAAAREGRLLVRCCTACAQGLFPPTAHCPACGSTDTQWREVAGTARLYAWTTVHHPIHPGYPVPYTIVLVSLDDLPEVKMPGLMAGEHALHAGMPMRVWFEALADGAVVPQWTTARDSTTEV